MGLQPGQVSVRARMSQIRAGLTREEWLKLAGMAAVIVGLNVLG